MDSCPAVCFTPPDRVALQEIALPSPGESEMVVQTLFSAVSPGTEVRCLHGQQTGVMTEPCIPGYQAIGRVVQPDPTHRFSEGDHVFFSRGRTPEGLVSFCGTHAAQAIVPTDKAIAVDPSADLPALTLSKVTAIALHGFQLAKVQPHERVAVIGLGLLGQISALIASTSGAELIALDRQPSRVEAAKTAGLDARVAAPNLAETPDLPPDGFDVIIDATGVPQVLRAALPLCRELVPWDNPIHAGSRYVLQGSFPGEVTLPYDELFMRELSLLVSRDSTDTDLVAASELIANRPDMFASLVGEVASPLDAESVYLDLASPQATRQTAVFDWARIL